jgi:hypothetical protein
MSDDTKADQANQAALSSGALPTTLGGASEQHEAMLCQFGRLVSKQFWLVFEQETALGTASLLDQTLSMSMSFSLATTISSRI